MNSELSNSQNKVINKIEDQCDFKNIKNDYILMKVFNNLQKKNSLEIIKCNKKIKERLNININDYKEYCETYSSIEIELVPINNKFGKFINIKEEKELYYHIYFNNNKEELKSNYLDEDDKANKISIIIDYQVKSFKKLFNYCCVLNMFILNNVIEIILII